MIENDVDMILVEYFFYIQEMEWAIELCRKVNKTILTTELMRLKSECPQYKKPIAATMAIGPKGDRSGVSAGECAVRSVPDLQSISSKNFSQEAKNKSQDGKGRRRHCWCQLPL